MRKIAFYRIVLLSSLVICLTVFYTKESSAEKHQLIQQWQANGLSRVPESVLYNPSNDTLYVSNNCGKPKQKNGQGYISRISPEGKIITLQWVEGLNAPKGMVIVGESLLQGGKSPVGFSLYRGSSHEI